ncbi:hypothetical protein CAEBREN_04176 [Caenorhabditis brenneri]|uniref:Uncharacterized protein n=1 Tax=Caenorhabditis brenneri TaxID=135651 RepID=G0MJ35_CAEBE|nr:hypothetical protein CAEBREN_04176 [Caenorhabditis brenneri]
MENDSNQKKTMSDWIDVGKDLKHIIRWSQNKNKTELVRTAALISSRHILLSSSVVLEGKNWIYSGQGFDEKKVCANKKNGYIDVPQEALEELGLGWQTKLTRAIIICNKDLFQYVKESWMSFPMILESKESLGDHNPFCLPGERYKLLKKTYGFYQYIVNKFVEEKLNVRGTEYPGFIDTDTYTIGTDGMLVDKKDGTLVGIGVTPGDDTHKGGFLNIILLAKDLCTLFGICENRIIIPLPPAPLSSAGKLTATENVKSKIKCGNESNSAFGYVTNGKTHSMMTMISPRHFLTMTNIIFDLVAWKPERCQGGGNQYFQLPPTVFDTLEFSWPKTTKIEKVFVVCNAHSFYMHERYGLPMIIEVKPNVDGDKPCLPSDKTLLKPKEQLQIYQYYETPGIYIPAKITLNYDIRPYLWTDSYKEATSVSGNPLFYKQGKDWTIVGVSTGVNNAFFSVQWMLKEICDLAGICELDEATTVPPKVPIVTKPPVAVTTKALTTVVPQPRPKPEAPSTEKPTTKKPTKTPTKPPKPATKPPKPPSVPPKPSPTTKKPVAPSPKPPTTPKAKEPITDSLNSTTESLASQQFENSTTIGITDPLNSDNSTAPSTFESSTPNESPEPTLEPIATIDLNEEYEEWKERDKIENVYKNRLVGTGSTGDKTIGATLISSRHILTSTELIFKGSKWAFSGAAFDTNLCEHDDAKFISVPTEAFTNLKPPVKFDWQGEINRAFIICNRLLQNYIYYFPLLIEFTRDFPVTPFCLPNTKQLPTIKSVLEIYDTHQTPKLNVSELKVFRYSKGNEVFLTKQYQGNRGDPLVANRNSGMTLVGIGASNNGYFFNIGWFVEIICRLFGICQSSGPLSLVENADRLESCGTKEYGDFNHVVSWMQNKIIPTVNTGIWISPRHVLTSAEVLLSANWTEKKISWRHNKQEVQFNECARVENVHIKVPPEALESLLFGWKIEKVTEGFIICNNYISGLVWNFYFPLLLEVKTDEQVIPFCLSDDKNVPNSGDPVTFLEHYDGVNPQTLKLESKTTTEYISAVNYTSFNSRGGALVHVRSGKRILVGSGAAVDNNKGLAWFFDIRWIINDLCGLFGTCQKFEPPPAPKPAPTTEAPTTVLPAPSPTEAPTTEKPTTEESTSEKPASSKAPEKSTKSPESTMGPESSTPEKSPLLETMEPIPVIDLDEEFREFQERQEKEDRGDWDEWGNDFYRSADFFSSGKRIELFVGFLVVVWRTVLR